MTGLLKAGCEKAAQTAKWLYKFTAPDEDKNFMISKLEGETLRMDHDALRRVFIRDELKNKKFAIISIAGKLRTGKSFLMNYVLRYFREKGWENSDWMGDGDTVVDDDGITFKSGNAPCTTGIRIFGEIFEVPVSKDETMMVMLMDTQGLFDLKIPKEVNHSLLTLTTLMSSVQIFNSVTTIDAQNMECLKTCVEFALETTKASQKNHDDGYMKLQNLMFLVRDYRADEWDIYGLEVGKNYLQDILYSDEGGEESRRIRSRIRESFDRVEGFAMPHPGTKAMKAKFDAKNKTLEEEFLSYVKKFVEHITSPDNLLPKQSSTGKVISPREMLNMIVACDEIFAKKTVDVQDMIKMNQKGHFSSLREEAVKEYDELMKNRINKKDGKKELEEKHDMCKVEAIQRLEKADLNAADDIKQEYLDSFNKTCDEHFVLTKEGYEVRKEKERIKCEKTFSALKKYKSMMKRVLPKPVTDADFEILHNKCRNSICKEYGDSVDPDYLQNCIIGIYENFKEDNIRNRKKEQRQQASDRAKSMWDEFLSTCQDESAMTLKRKKIEETILTEFLKPTESGATLERDELLNVLNKQYDEAKLQNQVNLERKRLKGERTEAVIKKYETMFKEDLFEPVSDERFEKLHAKCKDFVFEAYSGDVDVDKEALQHGVKQSCENLRRENIRKEQALRETVENASSDAETMWDEFLNTYRETPAMDKKKKEIRDEIFAKFLPVLKPRREELVGVLQMRYESAKDQNNKNWISAMKEADNAVDGAILAIKEDFSEIMVDRYLEEEVVKSIFDLFKKKAEYRRESKEVKKYFHKKFEKQCDAAMDEVLKKNDNNKPLLLVRMAKSFFRFIADLVFGRKKADEFSLFDRTKNLEVFRHLHGGDEEDETSM